MRQHTFGLAVLVVLLASCAPTAVQGSGPLLTPGQVWEMTPPAVGTFPVTPLRLTVGERTPGEAEGYTNVMGGAPLAVTWVFYRTPAQGEDHEAMIADAMMSTGKTTFHSICTVVDPSARPGGPYTGLYTAALESDLASPAIAKAQDSFVRTGKLPADAKTCLLRRVK